MTKIEGTNTAPIPPKPRVDSQSKSPEKNEPSTSAPRHSDSRPQKVQQRIRYWFTQAGIGRQHNTTSTRPESSVAKRKRVRAQKKLANLESIMMMAMEFSPNQASEEQLDPDWFFSFLDIAENIYSPAMQDLWSRILAVEVSAPGTFSLRSLLTLKQLTQKDAEVFHRAISLAVRRKGDHSPRIIYGFYQKPGMLNWLSPQRAKQMNLAQFGLPYPDILLMMDLGLIYRSEIESGELHTSQTLIWRYGSHEIEVQPKRNGLILNYYKFTSTGAELARLSPNQPRDDYRQHLISLLTTVFQVKA